MRLRWRRDGDHRLLSDRHRARYVILVFIRGKGLGGGLAVRTAASMAEHLIQGRHEDEKSRQ
jgi:hypothetical protein